MNDRFKIVTSVFFSLFLLFSGLTLLANNNKIVLMLDCSDSMKDDLKDLKISAKKFIALTPLACSEIAIYTFGSYGYLPFTNDKDKLMNFVNNLVAMGQTPMYSCLNRVYKDIDNIAVKGICLFSDGNPTDKMVSKQVKIRGDVPIYFIGYSVDEEGKKILNELAKKSGGETRFSSNISDLATLFSDFSVRISSKGLETEIKPMKEEKNTSNQLGGEIDGYYYFDKAVVFSSDPESSWTKQQKNDIVQYLKSYGYPNALFFNKQEIKLLTIDEESNQSEWLDGTLRFNKDTIDIRYTYVDTRYDIKVEVFNSYNNILTLKLKDFYQDEEWGLIQDGEWIFNDMVSSLLIYFVKDYCAQ